MSAGVRSPAGSAINEAPSAIGGTAASSTIRRDQTSQSERTPFWERLSSDVSEGSTVAIRNGAPIGELAFRSRVNAWRHVLRANAHQAVGLFEPNGVEFAAALLGAWYAGKTVFLPGDAQSETCRALIERGVLLIGTYPEVIAHVGGADDITTDEPFMPLTAQDASVVIFTSGSSGAPQAVPKKLTQLLAEVDTLESLFGGRMRGEIVATVSHQHIYGLLFKILWPLAYFRTFVAESLLYPEQLSEFVSVRDAVIVSGPAHLKRLPESLDWGNAAGHVSLIFSSGGPLPLEAASHAETLLGSAPIEVYGSSETGGIAWRQRTGAVEQPWTALPGVDVRAEEGRLAVRSAHLATADWLLVEDHAEFDEGSRFVLKGRADRVAKVEGKRVSLVAIEEALLQTALVTEVRVVQLESARDEIGAIVVPSENGWSVLRASGSSELRRTLGESLRGSVERIAHPRRWRWVDSLPVNAAGKTTNAAIAALFDTAGTTLPAMHVLSASGTEANCELYVSPQLPVFDGHFREIPVLPGVAQVDWAVIFARRLFRFSGDFLRMEAVKFQKVYQPGPLLALHLQWNAERRMLAFRYESPNSTHSSGRIFFGN